MRSSRYEARGKFGEHERCVRVARGVAESNSSFQLLLLVKTGKSKEEYAVVKALLNLSVEPVMSSGEQIKLLKMSYNPNGGDVLKFSTVFRKNGLAYYEILIRLKQWRRLFEIWMHWQNHFFDCGGDFH